MADAITVRADGTHEMAAVDGVFVWWENDQRVAGRLRPGASIEEWQVASGMDWIIRRSKAHYYADRAGTDLRAWADKNVLLRSDTGAPLGMVSPDYNIVQPYEVLEFFRNLTDTAGFQLETAGTLFGGSQFWATAKVAEAKVSGWDKIGGYVLINTSADGSRKTTVRDTTTCVVCANTLAMALDGASKKVVTVSHRENFDAERVQRAMGLSEEHFTAFIEAANTLTKVKVGEAAAEQFVLQLLRSSASKAQAVGDDEDDDSMEVESSRKPRGMDLILGLFDGAGLGATQKGRAGTAWGLVNAVTEYVDHHATAKSLSHRLQRAWMGTGDQLKTAALEKALFELV